MSGNMENFVYERLPKPLFPSQTRFSRIYIEDDDRLQLIDFTDAEIRAIENVIRVSWHKPIKVANFIPGSNPYAYEITVTGGPWSCSSTVSSTSSDSTPSCVLIRDLLVHLFSQGWIIVCSPSYIYRGLSTLFVWNPRTPPPKSEWLAINFVKRDHLRFIGAAGGEGFRTLIEGIRAPLKDMGYIQTEKASTTSKDLKYALYDFMIHGNPRNPRSEERVAVTMLLVRLLGALDRFGWSLNATVGGNIFGHDEKYFLGMMSVYQRKTWYCIRTVH